MNAVRIAMAIALLTMSGVMAQAPARGAVATTDVLVIGENGEPIVDLAAEDFEVLSDGAPVALGSAGSAPAELAVVLMVDLTTSQALKRHEVHTAVAEGWLPSLRAGDRARIAVVGAPAIFGPWLSGDRVANLNVARPTIDRASSSPSPIWDSTDAAIQALADAPGPKVVVLLSDGRAAANALGLEDVAARATAANVTISSVSEGSELYLPQAGDAAARIRSDQGLRRLADATGGIFVEDGVARRTTSARTDPFAYVRELLDNPSQPGPLLARIMSLMRQRYRLTFASARDGREHSLEVKVRRPGAIVHARRSYVAPAPTLRN